MNYYDQIVPEKTRTKKCRVCGKQFRYYPAYYYWKAKVDGRGLECVCSYTCMRTIEKREAELMQHGLRADFEEEAPEAVTRKRKPVTVDTEKIRAHLRKKLKAAQEQFQAKFYEEEAMRRDGVYDTLSSREKEKVRKRRYYWQIRIEELERELKRLNNAAATAK